MENRFVRSCLSFYLTKINNKQQQIQNPFESCDVLGINDTIKFTSMTSALESCRQIAAVYYIYYQGEQSDDSNQEIYKKIKNKINFFQTKEKDAKNKIVNQKQVLKLNEQMDKSEAHSDELQKQISQMQISLKKQQQLHIRSAKQQQQRQKKRAKQEQQKYKMIQQIFASLQKNQSQTGQIVKSVKLKEKAEQQRNEKENSETAKKSNNNQNDK